MLVDHDEDDLTQLWWVRLDGRATVLDGPERDRALVLLREECEQYRAQPPTGAVIAVRVERWRGWSGAQTLTS